MEEEKEQFQITDLKKATWAMRKIREAKSKVAEIEEVADEERSRIDEWVRKETKSEIDTINYMELLLIQFYETERQKDSKFKLTTPFGKLSSRKRQPSLKMDDNEVLEYLRQHELEDMIKVEEKYNKTELKKLIKIVEAGDKLKVIDQNGEVLDFIKAEPQSNSYTIKTD